MELFHTEVLFQGIFINPLLYCLEGFSCCLCSFLDVGQVLLLQGFKIATELFQFVGEELLSLENFSCLVPAFLELLPKFRILVPKVTILEVSPESFVGVEELRRAGGVIEVLASSMEVGFNRPTASSHALLYISLVG